jgi:hypothetical protein
MSFLLGLTLGICIQSVFTFHYHIIQVVAGHRPASSLPSYRDALTAPIQPTRGSFFWVMSFSLGLMLGFMWGIEPVFRSHHHHSRTHSYLIHALPYPLLTSHVSLVQNRHERTMFS